MQDNNNNNPTAPNTVPPATVVNPTEVVDSTTPVSPTVVATDSTSASTPSQKGFVGFMNSIPKKIIGLFNGIKFGGPKPKINFKKLAIFGGGGTILLIILALVIFLLTRPRPQVVVATPTPEPPVPIATPAPTKYATDPGVISISEKINMLDQNLGTTDLSEDSIRPRPLDFNVVFK